MTDSLDRFTRQLAVWADAIITHGRTPFRKVELYPKIITEQGVYTPSLVFWINRQSLIAGGLLLVPSDSLEKTLHQGRLCATALGLRYFVTWEERQVRIWQCLPEQDQVLESFPLGETTAADSFRLLLRDLLDNLKIQAVTGAVAHEERPASHLNNLFRLTTDDVLPLLTTAYGAQRAGQHPASAVQIDLLAQEHGRLLLLQILAVLWYDLLPEKLAPEDLPDILTRTLQELPDDLARGLNPPSGDPGPELPYELWVRFHHMILRLQQLSWNNPEIRALESIRKLTLDWYRQSGDLPADVRVELNPEGPETGEKTRMLLSDRPALLALTAFLRHLRHLPPIALYGTGIVHLRPEDLLQGAIAARLSDDTPINSAERRSTETFLRSSWPHRRFPIRSGQPLWLWELIHLLGLCRNRRRLYLTVPRDVLWQPAEPPVWSLIQEGFQIESIQIPEPRDRLNLVLAAGKPTPQDIPVTGEVFSTTLPATANAAVLRNRLRLIVGTPRSILGLLDSSLLWPSSETTLSETFEEGYAVYRKTGLYRFFLEQVHGRTDSVPETTDGQTPDIALPDPLALAQLADQARQAEYLQTPFDADQTLAALLGIPLSADPWSERPDPEDTRRRRDAGRDRHLKDEILMKLKARGIPSFPEQYLYFLDQPRLQHFRIAPPLRQISSFMGEFELEDGGRNRISGYGEELRDALLLAADSGKTALELPEDRSQLISLVTRYKEDLSDLYQQLRSLAYSQVTDSRSARKLIATIWEQLKLPTPERFGN